MVKYLKTGKRIITLVLSAALILGEASVSLAAPKANFEPAIDVVEESETTGAFTPGKVMNLGFKSYIATGVIDDKKASWNAVQGANTYQYRVVDTAGKEYAPNLNDYDSSKKVFKTIDYDYTSSLVRDLGNFGYRQIQAKDGGYIFAEDANGNNIHMKWGTTYKFQVRAVHYGADSDTYGPWSDPVSYTTNKIRVEKVSDFRLYQNNEGYCGITYSSSGPVEIEIKDAAGNYYYDSVYDELDNNGKFVKTVYEYETLSQRESGQCDFLGNVYAYIYDKSGNNSYTRRKDDKGNAIRAFMPGQTYQIRLRGYGYDDNGDRKVSDWSQPLSIKIAVTPKPTKPGNIKYDYEENQISFNDIDTAECYEFELKDAEGKIYTYYGYTIMYNSYAELSNFKQSTKNADGSYTIVNDKNGNPITAGIPGKKYTFRVRSVNNSNVYDNDKKEYPNQYSDWSDTYTFTVPAENNVDPTKVKVTGLRYDKGDKELWWETPEDRTGLSEIRYEVELKDNLNRVYNTIISKNGVQSLQNYITNQNHVSKISTFVKIDDKYQAVIDQNGDKIQTFREGLKYTARVRMIAWSGDSEEDKYGVWSDAYQFTVPVTTASTGINSKPAKVTGVRVESEAREHSTLDEPILYWNKIDNVGYFEIEVKDAAGNLFSEYANVIDGKLVPVYKAQYFDYNSIFISQLSNLLSYKKVDGSALSILRDSKGVAVNPFISGQNYTIRVRAVNVYYPKNNDGSSAPSVQYVGDWSDPITYSVNNDLKVKGLQYVKSDEEYYYFNLDADTKFSELYYQVASDASFSEGSICFGWYNPRNDYMSGYKFVIPKRYFDETESKTYYVRVVNSKYGYPDEVAENCDVNLYNSIIATAATTSFKTDTYEQPAVKNITNLKLYNETDDEYRFRFDAKLSEEDGDGFVIEINNVSSAANGNWSRIGSRTESEDTDYDFSVDKSDLLDGVNYIRVRAYNYVYDKTTKKSKRVYGQPSNVITINWNNKITSPIGTVALSEETDEYYYFTYTGNVRKDEEVEVFYSTSPSFETNHQEEIYWSKNTRSSDVNKEFSIYKRDLRPGRTYYLKMRVRNSSANTTAGKTSAYSNVVKFTAAFPKIKVKNSVVTKNSIKMTMDASFDSKWLSGFEIQRKSKSSWKTISKSSAATYTDKKLKAFKIYSYRIRPYFFDKETKKTSYGEWVYNEAMPGWSGTLNLTAKAASKTSAKLTWSKIKGAKGYEIYRLVTTSETSKVSKGEKNDYSSYKLIKTLGSGKKSYTDKKLTSGAKYEYVVKAYKKVGGKKVYIQDSASVNLDFYLSLIKSYKNSKGKVIAVWNPVMSAKGYKIEKLNNATGQWTVYKTIKKAKTSTYTFPAATDLNEGDNYRISAYNGKKSTNYVSIKVDPMLAAPTKVKATVSGNKITISWNKVSGADYYRVYRSINPPTTQEKDLNGYFYYSWSEIGRYVPDSSTVTGYRWRDLEEMNVTSVVDQELLYTKNGISNQTLCNGPATGVKYYYFVIAYKKKPQHGYSYDNDEADAFGGIPSNPASAMIKETKPAKPVLSKVSSKKKTVSVSIKGSVKADGYEIYRSTNKKKNFKSVGEITGPSPIYKDKYNKKKNKLKKGKTYYYKVRAFVYNDDGSKVYSAYSSVKKVKFK